MMAETTTATADVAPPERSMPVGYGFRPTDQEIVGHYLHHKLVGDNPSINETIPEIGICNHEPWDLLALVASASTTKFDESEGFFFRPRDYKYSNSTRWNRTTLGGFWKITGKGQEIHSKDTNKVIGTKKILVYHEGRVPYGIKTNWVVHEYHDSQLPLDQRAYILCWLKKNEEKIQEKHRKPINSKRSLMHQNEKTTVCLSSEEQYISNKSSKNCIDSTIQTPLESEKVIQESEKEEVIQAEIPGFLKQAEIAVLPSQESKIVIQESKEVIQAEIPGSPRAEISGFLKHVEIPGAPRSEILGFLKQAEIAVSPSQASNFSLSDLDELNIPSLLQSPPRIDEQWLDKMMTTSQSGMHCLEA